MRKLINGVWYDTEAASLITDIQTMTTLSGNVSIRLFKSHSGQWFQSICPVEGNGYQTISNWISPSTTRRWLENHSYHFQLREYFGYSDNRVKSERQVLIAEWKSPISTNSNELAQIERLYHQPHKGWCLKQTKRSTIMPLTVTEAIRLVKILQVEKGHIQPPLPSMRSYRYERDHSDHGRI